VQRRAFLRFIGVGGGIAVVSAGAGGTAVGAVEYIDDTHGREDGAFGGVGNGQQRVLWSVATSQLVVALTFDDGPNPRYTERVLSLLADRDVKASFFMIGRLVQQHPDLVQAVLAAGHEVGNHSWSHLSPALIGADTARSEIDRAADAIAAVAGKRPLWYRPPRGMITGTVLRHSFETGAGVAMWSVDRGAGADGDADAIRTHLVGALAPGAVIDMHDGLGRSTWDTGTSGAHHLMARREAELRALPAVLDASLSAGYRFATISDLAAMNTTDAMGRPATT
jgi:peptidoglycan/xylan/chitin deacetylase (PgdA/CDA1 family)